MKRFELWLDESGDFENDAQKCYSGANPSLIGGILAEIGTFSGQEIKVIFPEDGTYHSVNEKDQLDRFRLMEDKLFKNKANRIIVFSNQECIMVIDNNLTYLNIISEGIMQLIKQLKVWYGDIFLRVIIANRVNTTTGLNSAQSVVPVGEYEKRLKEKLIIAGLDHLITQDEWELQTASARKDKRLMLADVVCNTFFTRYRKKKFNAMERAYIEKIYCDEEKTLVFTFLESLLEKKFKDDLMNNRIGEAVANICLSKEQDILKRCFALLEQKLSNAGTFDIRLQYKFIAAYIEYYINVVRDFDVCINLFNNLQKYYVKLLKESKVQEALYDAERLELDIKFYLLTAYTHTGNVKMSDKLESECQAAMEKLPASLDAVTYRIKFELRHIINLINTFELDEALLQIDHLISKCAEVEELLEFIYSDRTVAYEEMAKALGTRVQVKTLLLRKNKGLYLSACRDSETAISKFESWSDICRQYLYRAQLETEAKRYEEAFEYLCKSVGLNKNSEVKELWDLAEKSSYFVLSAYIRLMAEGALNEWEQSARMYECLSKSAIIQKLEISSRQYHPVELIFWKLGTYFAANKMGKAALRKYEKAIKICFDTDDIAMNIIGIAIELEQYSVSLRDLGKENILFARNLRKSIDQVKERDNWGMIDRIWGTIETEGKESDYYWNLSRRITY